MKSPNKSGLFYKKCKRCRELIDKDSLRDYCDDCYRIVEEVFDKIRNYLNEFPGATAYEIETETGVSMRIINNYVKDGRLVEIPNEFIHIDCKGCGTLLLSAHSQYCPMCREKMRKEIEDTLEKKQNNQEYQIKGKMHLDHLKYK